jgi:hypothetical protein
MEVKSLGGVHGSFPATIVNTLYADSDCFRRLSLFIPSFVSKINESEEKGRLHPLISE